MSHRYRHSAPSRALPQMQQSPAACRVAGSTDWFDKEAKLRITGANRSFGLLLVAVCAVLGLISYSRGGGAYVAFCLVGLLLAIVSLWIPRVLAPLRRGWMRLGHVLGRFVNPVVLGLSYAVVIVPAGLLMRV